MLQSQQNMAIWVSNKLSHSVEMTHRLEENLLRTIFYKKKKGKNSFPKYTSLAKLFLLTIAKFLRTN